MWGSVICGICGMLRLFLWLKGFELGLWERNIVRKKVMKMLRRRMWR